MKALYERENLIITAFDAEDVITTSSDSPTPFTLKREIENVYRTFGSLNDANDAPGSWF